MASDDFRTESVKDECAFELIRVRKENDALKAHNAGLLKLAKQAIVQNITSMDAAKFLQFATAYEELQKGR